MELHLYQDLGSFWHKSVKICFVLVEDFSSLHYETRLGFLEQEGLISTPELVRTDVVLAGVQVPNETPSHLLCRCFRSHTSSELRIYKQSSIFSILEDRNEDIFEFWDLCEVCILSKCWERGHVVFDWCKRHVRRQQSYVGSRISLEVESDSIKNISIRNLVLEGLVEEVTISIF